MIGNVQPAPSYDANNEAQFRTQVRLADARNMKKDEALSYLTLLNDDGTVMRGRLVAGVLTWEVFV